jgi:hypothetical protein
MKYKNRFDVPDDRGPLYYISDEEKNGYKTMAFGLTMGLYAHCFNILKEVSQSPLTLLYGPIFENLTEEEVDECYELFINSQKELAGDSVANLSEEMDTIYSLALKRLKKDLFE